MYDIALEQKSVVARASTSLSSVRSVHYVRALYTHHVYVPDSSVLDCYLSEIQPFQNKVKV